jgi:hypothetical protein
MKSKNITKRLQARMQLQSLQPRISRPPDGLEMILSSVEEVAVEFEVPSYRELLRNGRRLYVDLLTRSPELANMDPPVTYADYRRSVVLAQWSKSLRQIAQGSRQSLIEVVYTIDHNGEFQISRHDALIKALNACGKKHDLRHLRECAVENCKKLFWAKKLPKDQLDNPQARVGCCDKCKNILRVRKKRAADKLRPKPARAKKPSAQSKRELIIAVGHAVKDFCRERDIPDFPRSPENVKLIANRVGTTIRKTNYALGCLLDRA